MEIPAQVSGAQPPSDHSRLGGVLFSAATLEVNHQLKGCGDDSGCADVAPARHAAIDLLEQVVGKFNCQFNQFHKLSPRNRPDDQQRLETSRHRLGQRVAGVAVGEIQFTGEEAHEGATLLGC